MLTKPQRRLLFLSSLGGILEFYDFVIYALFASYIAHNFFPIQNTLSSLMATFATFSVGYLARPLGGIVFGHFGDKVGRKKTFTLSILMMAIATFSIALVPTYAQIGVFAPIILTFLRVCQGMALGGEIPGAIAYVGESLPEQKGLACSFILFAVNSGIVFGILTHAVLQSVFTPEQVLKFGWRIPFVIGGLFGFISYQLRQALEESPIFRNIEDKLEAFPLLKVLKQHPLNIVTTMCIVGLAACSISLLFLFIASYLKNVLHISSSYYPWYSALATFLASIFCVVIGWLSDRVNRKKLSIFIALFTLSMSYPIFWIYAQHFNYYLVALLLSFLTTGALIGLIPGLLAESFPTSIRYSGIATSYNLGFALFGGFSPLVALILVSKTHLTVAPAFCLMAISLLAIPATCLLKKYAIQQ